MTLFAYLLFGYLSGSILYIHLYSALFAKKDATLGTEDGNPGTFNAFEKGGFWCGLFVLLGDLGKAFLPVYLYTRTPECALIPCSLMLVMWAPVFGHLFPIFYRFRGGKGIAATFGSALGVWAGQVSFLPTLALIVLFLTFTLVIRIRPNFYMTGLVFILYAPRCLALQAASVLVGGAALTSVSVLARLGLSKEARPDMEVSFLWKR